MLRRKKARRLRVLESRRAEEIALDSARSGAPISPDATERQSAPTELTVAGDRKFESCSLQRRVCKLSVPEALAREGSSRRHRRTRTHGQPRRAHAEIYRVAARLRLNVFVVSKG